MYHSLGRTSLCLQTYFYLVVEHIVADVGTAYTGAAHTSLPFDHRLNPNAPVFTPSTSSKPSSKNHYASTLLAEALRPHVLSAEQLREMGYPRAIGSSTKAEVYMKTAPWLQKQTQLDANAPAFTPGARYRNMRPCARCRVMFDIDSDVHLTPCKFHGGRKEDGKYSCCSEPVGSPACASVPYHVHQSMVAGLNGPLEGYVRTQALRGGVYALDAEMIYTTAGMELASLALVDANGNVVYETLVKPTARILDLNTTFSGIRPEDMFRAVKTLKDVQKDILDFIGCDTILVGHALDNDLRALKLIHGAVVDTCALYPHWLGLPFRLPLRVLAEEKLGRKIQSGQAGHAPDEDALAALDLALLKIKG